MSDSRERDCLLMLKDHFNSNNKYSLDEKIEVAKMIIEDGLKKPIRDDRQQLRLEF